MRRLDRPRESLARLPPAPTHAQLHAAWRGKVARHLSASTTARTAAQADTFHFLKAQEKCLRDSRVRCHCPNLISAAILVSQCADGAIADVSTPGRNTRSRP